jgi:hypothetical protein
MQQLLTVHRRLPAQAVCETTVWDLDFDRNRGYAQAQKESIWQTKAKKSAHPWNGIFKVLFQEDLESSYPPECKFPTFLFVRL